MLQHAPDNAVRPFAVFVDLAQVQLEVAEDRLDLRPLFCIHGLLEGVELFA